MNKQIATYEEKMDQAEKVLEIRRGKIAAYKEGIAEIDKILKMPVKRLFFKILLGIKDITRIELKIKRFDFMESLSAEEHALRVQNQYLDEDRKVYEQMVKNREIYTKEIEEGKFEEMKELLRTKIRQTLVKNKNANLDRIQGLLEDCNKADTLEKKLELYEALKINHK